MMNKTKTFLILGLAFILISVCISAQSNKSSEKSQVNQSNNSITNRVCHFNMAKVDSSIFSNDTIVF